MEVKVYGRSLELGRCPHVLVGGCSGSGKSYLIKSMLCDVLEGSEDCRVLVIDPKSVDYQFLVKDSKSKFVREVEVSEAGDTGRETVDKYGMLGLYSSDGRVVRDVSEREFDTNLWLMRGLGLLTRRDIECGNVLRWLSNINLEMDRRYQSMVRDGLTVWPGPPIIVVIDELADLMYWDRSDTCKRAGIKGRIEDILVRISTLGRAAGIHLIMGTQRPDATILSGQLRGNIGCRICLRAINTMERRIILGDSCKDLGEKVMFYDGQYVELES